MRGVKIVLEKPLTKAYLLFLFSALPIVNHFNRYMQQQSPILHVLYQELNGVNTKISIVVHEFWVHECCWTCFKVCIDNSEEYLPLHELFVGNNTLSYVEEDGLSSEDVRKFRETIQTWLFAAAKGAVKDYLRVTSYSPISNSFNQAYNNTVWLVRCLLQQSVVPQVVQVGDKPSLQRGIDGFLHVAITS